MGLNHGESLSAVSFKSFSCSDIAVVGDFEDTRKNCNLSSNEEVFQFDARDFNFLKEDTRFLYVIHFDHVGDNEIVEGVFSDNGCLVVVPV